MLFMNEGFVGSLFLERGNYTEENKKHHGLTSKVHLLMKRLKQDYNTLMFMPSSERDLFFEWELEVLEEEEKASKQK